MCMCASVCVSSHKIPRAPQAAETRVVTGVSPAPRPASRLVGRGTHGTRHDRHDARPESPKQLTAKPKPAADGAATQSQTHAPVARARATRRGSPRVADEGARPTGNQTRKLGAPRGFWGGDHGT